MVLSDKNKDEKTQSATETHEIRQEESHARAVRVQLSITSEARREAQLADQSIAWLLQAKDSTSIRPDWETVSLKSAAVKIYWTRWDQLQVKNEALYHKWESDNGKVIRWHREREGACPGVSRFAPWAPNRVDMCALQIFCVLSYYYLS